MQCGQMYSGQMYNGQMYSGQMYNGQMYSGHNEPTDISVHCPSSLLSVRLIFSCVCLYV